LNGRDVDTQETANKKRENETDVERAENALNNSGASEHPQMVDDMPREFGEILKILRHSIDIFYSGGTWVLEDGASYKITYYPNVQEFDFSVASIRGAKLKDVKSILMVFFPYSYELAYQYLIDTRHDKEVNIVLDGRTLATEFYIDRGVMIIGLAP